MSPVVCKVPYDWIQIPSVCLYEWQAIITGIAAVLVGGFTVWFLKKQIDQSDRFTQEERDARLTVARAKLMVPSSGLAEHARYAFAELARIEPAVTQRVRTTDPINIPQLPSHIQSALDALLANSPERDAIFCISAIYGEQQVLSARGSDMHEDPPAHALSLDYYFMQPTIMHAIAMNLLGYARFESDTVGQINWNDMRLSVRSLAPDGVLRTRLIAFIDDKAEREIAIPYAIRPRNA